LDCTTILLSINGTIGNVAYYEGESIILGKSASYINCGSDLSREFLYFFLRDFEVIEFLQGQATGTTILNLSLESIRSLPVPLPPNTEQATIVNALQKKLTFPIRAIEMASREIELLREYRARLIADVVTGKLDVREAAANLPDEPEDADLSEELNVVEESMEEDLDTLPEEAEV